MKMKQSVPNRRHIKFRRRGITQKKIYNVIYIAYVQILWASELCCLGTDLVGLCVIFVGTDSVAQQGICYMQPATRHVTFNSPWLKHSFFVSSIWYWASWRHLYSIGVTKTIYRTAVCSSCELHLFLTWVTSANHSFGIYVLFNPKARR
jgi:hypothetical protein